MRRAIATVRIYRDARGDITAVARVGGVDMTIGPLTTVGAAMHLAWRFVAEHTRKRDLRGEPR